MKLRIPTRRRPPGGEEEHAEQPVRAVRRLAEAQRPVPLVCRAEDLMVAVSGDPLRTNAYAFAHNGILGYPTTKAVRLPADWARLLREARAR